LSSHQLQIEKGRYNNTLRSERLCLYCNLHEVEDEFHFVLICPKYYQIRTKFVRNYYWSRPSVYKLVQLLSIQNRKHW